MPIREEKIRREIPPLDILKNNDRDNYYSYYTADDYEAMDILNYNYP